jgi:hypothetical protein
MKKENILMITWIILVLLTVVEYAFTEISVSTKIAFGGILIASFIKYVGVAFEFLELKHAHPFWKYFTVTIVLAFFGLLTILYL